MEDIKSTYRRLAMEFHPDQAHGADEQEVTSIFSKVAQAYTVLSDPISRSMYDLNMGYVKDNTAERKRINLLKRNDAERRIELSESTVAQVREEEAMRNGLIILEALYGDVSVGEDDQTSTAGKCIDVTIPLQCAVKQSALVVHGGGSKAWLEGFYDPNDNAMENVLYVRYRFLGALHECIVGDQDELCLPLEEHMISDAPNEWDMETEDDDDDCDIGDDDDTMSVDSTDSDAMDMAAERARAKWDMKKKSKKSCGSSSSSGKAKDVSLRHRSRVKPRLQSLHEMNQVKARRRRNLYMCLGAIVVGVGMYAAHRTKVINFQNVLDTLPKIPNLLSYLPKQWVDFILTNFQQLKQLVAPALASATLTFKAVWEPVTVFAASKMPSSTGNAAITIDKTN